MKRDTAYIRQWMRYGIYTVTKNEIRDIYDNEMKYGMYNGNEMTRDTDMYDKAVKVCIWEIYSNEINGICNEYGNEIDTKQYDLPRNISSTRHIGIEIELQMFLYMWEKNYIRCCFGKTYYSVPEFKTFQSLHCFLNV